jgi:hypothetical protein
MDDIVIGSENEDKMMERLTIVFERLAKYNLKIQLSKIRFFQRELKILGVIFSGNGKRIDPEKIQAIDTFPEPKNIKDVQRLLSMLCYLSSFIPNYSTRLFPVFQLLKNQKTKKFEMTQEAAAAIEEVKNFLKSGTMTYNIELDRPIYLMTDASNVAMGAFLYQIDVYEKTDENKALFLEKYGYVPETNSSVHLMPGVSPGKNVPIVLDFVKDRTQIEMPETLDPTLTMSQKIKNLENSIVHIKPIFWFSKLFTEGQRIRYTALEKEFWALISSVIYFRDYLEAARISYVLTDSQALLWAIAHKSDQLKLSRHLIKLNEMNVNIIFSHIAGTKNVIADYLSRVCYVPDDDNDPDPHFGLKAKEAQHVVSNLPVLTPLTMSDILDAFDTSCIQKCFDPQNCPLNVNAQLYRGIGPFQYEATPKCRMKGVEGEGECKKKKLPPYRTLNLNLTLLLP